MGFESELQQVILNLLINSKDELIHKKIGNGYIKINIFKEMNFTVFKICDNAGGIPNEFIQALINIINNSLDIFEKSEDTKKYIFIETKVDEDEVKIILKDSGGGIPDNLIDSIFEQYNIEV